MALWNRLLNRMEKSDGRFTNWYENLIASSAGIDPWYDTTSSPQERAEAYREYLFENKKNIITENLIQMLWLATDAEKLKALDILKSETGQEFTAPGEWLDWWRKNSDKLEN